MNRGPYKITSVKKVNDHIAYYFIQYPKGIAAIFADITKITEHGMIRWMNIHPL